MTITLDATPEQRQIQESACKLLDAQFPLARLRGAHQLSPDRVRLAVLAEFGAWGLGLSEDLGGAGFGLPEDMLLSIELGRNLVSPTALAATLGARVAVELGQDDLARAVMSGQQPICLANALAPFQLGALDSVVVHLLDVDADRSARTLALLWHDEGIGLLRLDGMALQGVAATDRSVTLHRATLRQGSLLGVLDASATRWAARAQLLLSAQLLGMAEATRDMAVAYARLRTQFGRPIGAFQAIKHRCADMAIRAEVLRAQLVLATLAERDRWPDAGFQIDACRMLAARHALANARANIQIHGGIGFAAECDAHLYLLRAHLYEHLGGAPLGAEQRLLRQRFVAAAPGPAAQP